MDEKHKKVSIPGNSKKKDNKDLQRSHGAFLKASKNFLPNPPMKQQMFRSDAAILKDASDTSSVTRKETMKRFEAKYDRNAVNASNKVVDELVNGMFKDKVGIFKGSSSSCLSVQPKPVSCRDRRLEYHKKMLQDRKYFENYIKERTGKKSKNVLFNRRTTVDAPDKQTVLKVLDFAERLNPANQTKKRAMLPEKCILETGLVAHKIDETIPKAEQEGFTRKEVSALPAATRKEMIGQPEMQGDVEKWGWIKGGLVKKHICEHHTDLKRVIEHFPDTENLQIVGDSLVPKKIKHEMGIKLVWEPKLRILSSEESSTKIECKALEEKPIAIRKEVDFAIKINDLAFSEGERRTSGVDFKFLFECVPYETLIRRIVRLENIGKKILDVKLEQVPYYVNAQGLLQSTDHDFLFDKLPFRLLPGQTHDLIFQYSPRRVGVVKERWKLKVEPQYFFCRKKDSVFICLTGSCKPPPAYLAKLNKEQQLVIDKSNKTLMNKLTNALGSEVPMLEPCEVLCPYKRLLDDRELFEHLNIGYKCERFQDIELLRELYHRIKKPREPEWNLELNSLQEKILLIDNTERRALLFSEMRGVLQDMSGPSILPGDEDGRYSERDQARFIYVRGIVCTAIDEWELLAARVEGAFYKIQLHAYRNEMAASAEKRQSSEDDERKKVLERVKRNKDFRDTLHLQTYSLLCNFAESIVSVIESTDVF